MQIQYISTYFLETKPERESSYNYKSIVTILAVSTCLPLATFVVFSYLAFSYSKWIAKRATKYLEETNKKVDMTSVTKSDEPKYAYGATEMSQISKTGKPQDICIQNNEKTCAIVETFSNTKCEVPNLQGDIPYQEIICHEEINQLQPQENFVSNTNFHKVYQEIRQKTEG